MQNATHASIQAMREATTSQQYQPPFPPLELVTKPNVTTAEVAYYANQAEQTWRVHACRETFPDGLRPLRIGGRLNWPTVGLKKLLGIAPMQTGFTTLVYLACIIGVALLIKVVLTAAPDFIASLDWTGAAMLGVGVIRTRGSMTTLYQHPDGHSIDFTDNTLTVVSNDGMAVSIPIGPYGLLLLGDKMESLAAGEHPVEVPELTATKGNGLDAANDQPAKTLTKYATDFIAETKAVLNDSEFPRFWCSALLVLAAALTLESFYAS